MIDFLASLEQIPFFVWVRESGSIWGYAMILFLHTMGMAVVVGLSSLIDLRLLGISPKTPLKPLEWLYPWTWWGFAVSAASGTILLIADATTKLTNPTFYVKMGFVILGVAVLQVMRTRVFGDPQLDQGPVTSSARNLAWISLVCWIGAITAGRLLAYLGPVSGLPGLKNL